MTVQQKEIRIVFKRTLEILAIILLLNGLVPYIERTIPINTALLGVIVLFITIFFWDIKS